MSTNRERSTRSRRIADGVGRCAGGVLLALAVAACGGAPRVGEEASSAAASPSVATARAVDEAAGLFRAGRLDEAAALLERHLATSAKDAGAWELLGRIRKRAEATDEALAAFERAVALDRERWGALYGMAGLYARRGEKERALELLRRIRDGGAYDLSAIALDPDFAGIRNEPAFSSLLLRPEEFENPFVEPARVLHEWRGEAEGDAFGWIARNIGDVDGDGVADFVTSAPSKAIGGPNAGRVYAYSSRTGALLWTRDGEPGARLGHGLETAGDVDGDGTPDVVAGAPGADRVDVYAGKTGELLRRFEGEHHGESFGQHVMGVGDVDGDGHGDVLVGAPGNDRAGENAGRAVLFSGRDGAILREWLGEEPGDRLGEAVAGRTVGGRTVLLIGAPDAGPGDRGRVDVYTGLDGPPRFRIDSDERGAELGAMFLSVVGDVDADGTPDVYASDWSHGARGPTTGKIVVHSGADGRELLALVGEAAGDGFGIGPADAGDVDGDGHADLVVGAWRHSSAAPSGGKVYLFSGRDGTTIRSWTSRVMGDTLGFDATGLGDVDGDGSVDLLVTAAWSAVRGARSGRIFLLAATP